MIPEDRVIRHFETLGEHPREPGPRLMRWESRDRLPVVVEVTELAQDWQQQADAYAPERIARSRVDGLEAAWMKNRKRDATRRAATFRLLAAD